MKLTVIPTSYQFGAHEETELARVLADMDRQTVIMPVSSSNDLVITREGKTITGDYQYSDTALLQLCAIVAPGLAQLVMDVSGQWRKPGEDRRLFSEDLTTEIFNKTLRLRFDRKLLGLQIVRNVHAKTIDGIVGMKYRYLSNGDFLSRVSLACGARKARFHEACLYGRHLIIRYVNQQSLPTYTIAGEPYTFGFHFANSEIGGRSARAASLIVRLQTGDCALSPFTGKSGGRVVHSGRDFERRLHSLLDTILRTLPSADIVREGGKYIESRALKLGSDRHDHQVRHYSQVLTRRKLTQDFARRVVSSAASIGRGTTDSLVDQLPLDQKEVLIGRTEYDLFVALIREARRLPINQREVAEQVAYALLMNKI